MTFTSSRKLHEARSFKLLITFCAATFIYLYLGMGVLYANIKYAIPDVLCVAVLVLTLVPVIFIAVKSKPCSYNEITVYIKLDIVHLVISHKKGDVGILFKVDGLSVQYNVFDITLSGSVLEYMNPSKNKEFSDKNMKIVIPNIFENTDVLCDELIRYGATKAMRMRG